VKIDIVRAEDALEAVELAALEARMFRPADRLTAEDWKEYEAFWILADMQTAGSIALGLNMNFSGFFDKDMSEQGCLYLVSTGILPEFQGRGIGNIVKRWEVEWARTHRFTRISTNCRASNTGSLRLNQKFGFKIIGEVPNYYEAPIESAIAMELTL